jgi:hypothetical protein
LVDEAGLLKERGLVITVEITLCSRGEEGSLTNTLSLKLIAIEEGLRDAKL